MPTTAQDHTTKAPDYSGPRSEDWSEYRNRALTEGKKFLTAVDGILDVVRAGRSVSEKQGRVPDRSVDAMISTGLFRAFTPLRYGGLEMDPASFFEGIMRIAEADTAAAWIAGQLNVHSFEIALMDERLQDEFWGPTADARASSSYAPIGKREQVDGGYVLNGTWTFSSGVDHAQWIILGGADRNFVVPARGLHHRPGQLGCPGTERHRQQVGHPAERVRTRLPHAPAGRHLQRRQPGLGSEQPSRCTGFRSPHCSIPPRRTRRSVRPPAVSRPSSSSPGCGSPGRAPAPPPRRTPSCT